MSQRESTTATVPFVPPVRAAPPAYPTSEIALEAPPAPAGSARAGLLVRLLPVLMALATVGVMVAVTRSGAGAGRHPTFLVFPAMMLISAVVAAVTGRDGRAGELNGSRVQYLAYLSALRDNVTRTAAAQRSALLWCHPEPDSLWTLVGSSRMWERRPEDPDFNQVRVGVGTQRLATPLVAPEIGPADAVDPVTVTALRVFARAHATIADAPTVIGLGPSAAVTTDGDPAAARGLLRAMVCQLAVLQAPDRLLIAAATGGRNRSHWDWLKWLPHNQHPNAADAVGSSRMVYPTLREAETALAGLFDRAPQSTLAGLPQIVLIVDGAAIDGAERIDGPITGVTILEVGIRHRCLSAVAGVQLQMTTSGLLFRDAADAEVLARPDWISVAAAQVCARQLAAYRLGGSLPGAAARWQDMLGVNDLDAFDPAALWRGSHYRDRLCVPVGTTPDGASVELDIKEAAENGIGPHGLCVGATGSGKSEFLRTVALGMMARHSPETLNLVLVDFKGGATFRGLEPAPHVAAVITNLADDAVLVDRMRDALAGEMNRRQEMLRVAGNLVSVAAYEQARRAGAQLAALPALFIIVDEFSELLMQQPDFVDMFCAIGRLGRSLGMYLLLASQRLDEGRLRGLESHLSYRVCLKTLTAGESRVVLGTPDAYHLPNTPGAALLRTGAGDMTRFQTVFVSALLAPVSPQPVLTVTESAPSVRVFSATPAGRVTAIRAGRADQVGGPTVLQTVVQRLCRSGPPARVVWLPPLGAPPALDAVLREGSSVSGGLSVPIGIVDRPFEQRRTRLTVELAGAAGNVAVVGSPQSGKTTALRTLLTGLAVTHDPCQVQFYCLDFGGGALASVRCLPHTGSVAGRAEPELAAGTIARLESIVRRRERFFRDHAIESMAQYRQFRSVRGADGDGFGDVFLVIDGWAAMRQQFEMLEAPITGLAVHGLSHGVHVVLSASRWAEIRPALKDAIGTRIELRLGDAADSELDRKHAQRVPKNSPGRGLSADGLQMAIALPRLDGISSSAGLAEATVRLGRALHDRYSGSVAPPVPLLPACVGHDRVLAQVSAGLRDGVLLGLEGHELRPVTVDFGRDPHLLILGDIECGKTTTLRTLCREIVRTRTADQARLVIADFRRGLIGVATSAYLGGYAMSAPALAALMPKIIELLRRRMAPAQAGPEQLRTRSWWSGPDLYVVVDDYHLVAAASGNPLAPLLEYLPYATDLGLHLIIARRSAGAARAMFEPLLSGLRDAGATGLIMSGSPDEGPLIGSVRPAPLPPGRGILATRNRDQQLVQVAWTTEP